MTVMKLPETVALCTLCHGYGGYRQRFIEGNFASECDMCKGMQFVYKCTAQPVPKSVREQIKNANDLEERTPRLSMSNVLWPKDASVDEWHITPSGACYEIKSDWPAAPVVEKRK